MSLSERESKNVQELLVHRSKLIDTYQRLSVYYNHLAPGENRDKVIKTMKETTFTIGKIDKVLLGASRGELTFEGLLGDIG